MNKKSLLVLKVGMALTMFSSVGFSNEKKDSTIDGLLYMKDSIKCIEDVKSTEHDTNLDNDEGLILGAYDHTKTDITIQKTDGTKETLVIHNTASSSSNPIEVGASIAATGIIPVALFVVGKGVTGLTALAERPFSDETYPQIYENQGESLGKVTSALMELPYYVTAMTLTADNRLYSVIKANSEQKEVLAQFKSCK